MDDINLSINVTTQQAEHDISVRYASELAYHSLRGVVLVAQHSLLHTLARQFKDCEHNH